MVLRFGPDFLGPKLDFLGPKLGFFPPKPAFAEGLPAPPLGRDFQSEPALRSAREVELGYGLAFVGR